MTITILISLIVVGWLAASILGTQAYFLGEQTKPIHERNWRSESFDQMATSVTGKSTDYANRTPAYSGDAYASSLLPNA